MVFGSKKKDSSPAPEMKISRAVYDFEFCEDLQELKVCMASINVNGYRIVSVTENQQGGYTVFFSRFAYG